MNNRAQISLESMLVLAAILIISTWFISTLMSTSSKARTKIDSNSKTVLSKLVKK